MMILPSSLEQVFAAGDKMDNHLPGQSPKEQQSLSIDRYRNVDIFSEILLLANKEKLLPSGTTAAIVWHGDVLESFNAVTCVV